MSRFLLIVASLAWVVMATVALLNDEIDEAMQYLQLIFLASIIWRLDDKEES
jgi:hypothetical protein